MFGGRVIVASSLEIDRPQHEMTQAIFHQPLGNIAP